MWPHGSAQILAKRLSSGNACNCWTTYPNALSTPPGPSTAGTWSNEPAHALAPLDAVYGRLVQRALHGGAYVAIATHDELLIEQAARLAEEQGYGRDQFEFQMLYGVRPQLQLDLVARGFKVLVATPFGPQWYPYLMRRLAERPANLLFLLRNLFAR